MMYGIDVSSYQGKPDWRRIKQAGCRFAVLKCIRKDLEEDNSFPHNISGCRKYGIPVSVYTYVYERTVEGAEKRARAAVEACRKHGVADCIIWWDVEDKSIRKSGVDSRAQLTRSILAARALIEGAGYGFGVYCDADFYTSCVNANHIGGKWWLARYGGNPVTAFGSRPAGKKPAIANELCGWQYCSRGRVPGISGSVDLDIAYDEDFLGYTSAPETTDNPYPAPTCTITSNARAEERGLKKWRSGGAEVMAVQTKLRQHGYDLGPCGVDGNCGPATVAAIEFAQWDRGLTVDGCCGPATWAELDAEGWTACTFRERVAIVAKTVYPLCVGMVHGGENVGKVVDLASLKRYKALSCNRMVSIVLQEAGLLPKGVIVAHTPKRSGKRSISDAVSNAGMLMHCELHWVNKKYSELPAEYRKAGCVYFQNSNACISAGGGKIWSCNKSKGYKYKRREDYLRTGGYPFTSTDLVMGRPE